MSPEHDDREQQRQAAEAVTVQARWLYELHAKRAESAQQRATALIAVSGVLLTFAPKALPQDVQPWQVALLVMAQIVSMVTIVLAAECLRPISTEVTSAKELRATWAAYRKTATGNLVAQVAEDLLRSTEMDRLSAVEFAKMDADSRIVKLRRAYWALVVALGLTATLATVAALQEGIK